MSYSFEERRREKEKSREEDRRALESGEKTAEQLRRENCHFSGLNVKLNLKRSRALW